MNKIELFNQEVERMRKECANEILIAVCEVASTTSEQITESSRVQRMNYCRIILAYNLRRIGMTSIEAGRVLNRDHATVIHLANRYVYEHSPEFLSLAEAIYNKLTV